MSWTQPRQAPQAAPFRLALARTAKRRHCTICPITALRRGCRLRQITHSAPNHPEPGPYLACDSRRSDLYGCCCNSAGTRTISRLGANKKNGPADSSSAGPSSLHLSGAADFAALRPICTRSVKVLPVFLVQVRSIRLELRLAPERVFFALPVLLRHDSDLPIFVDVDLHDARV